MNVNYQLDDNDHHPRFIQQLKQKVEGLSRTVTVISQAPKSTACNTQIVLAV